MADTKTVLTCVVLLMVLINAASAGKKACRKAVKKYTEDKDTTQLSMVRVCCMEVTNIMKANPTAMKKGMWNRMKALCDNLPLPAAKGTTEYATRKAECDAARDKYLKEKDSTQLPTFRVCCAELKQVMTKNPKGFLPQVQAAINSQCDNLPRAG